ncbi:MAG: hypothetical protein H6741_21415 [Alphaproteobacteria bacterium]|nr:hypothetical protein [Alphaproteobacteria bacterium]
MPRPANAPGRRLAFALLPLLLLAGAVEGGLRALGYQGEADRGVSWCREHVVPAPPFFPVRRFAEGVSGRVARLDAQTRPFAEKKPAGVRRYFALGGSAVHGYGFTRPGAWAHGLEERLAQRWPGQDVEVINAGVIAWSSQQVLTLVKDILAHHEPDGLLIYAGNNELLEWFDARQYLPEPALRRWVRGLTWARRLRRLRGYRLGVSLLADVQPGVWGQTSYSDDDALPRAQWAPLTPADRDFAVASLAYNLGRVLELAEAAGVPVVLSTVGVNLDYAPGALVGAAGEGAAPLVEAGRQALREGADVSQAGAAIDAAFDQGHDPGLPYAWAQALREAGHPEAARVYYERALRWDENPHRALPEVNAELRRLGRRAAGFVDGEQILNEAVPDGLADWRVLYDHCHPTPAGHALLAEGFAEVLAPTGEVPPPAPPPPAGHVDAWLGEGVTEDPGSFARDPGTERSAWLARARAETAAHPEDAAAWNQQGVVSWHLVSPDCERGTRACAADALEAFERAIALDPGLCVARANRGRVLFALGEAELARAALEAAVACEGEGGRSGWYLERLGRRG